eukprot:5691605-Pleurochrysis_carterae.AAC.1
MDGIRIRKQYCDASISISPSPPVLAVRTLRTKRTGKGASRLRGVLGNTSASRASMLRLSYELCPQLLPVLYYSHYACYTSSCRVRVATETSPRRRRSARGTDRALPVHVSNRIRLPSPNMMLHGSRTRSCLPQGLAKRMQYRFVFSQSQGSLRKVRTSRRR